MEVEFRSLDAFASNLLIYIKLLFAKFHKLMRVSPVLLLLSYTSLLNLVQVTPDDLLPLPEFKTDFVTSSGTQFSEKSVLDSQTASLHMVRRGFKSNYQRDVVSPQSVVFVTPNIDSLTTSGQNSNFTTGSNASSFTSGLAEPPFSHHSGCCGTNMVQRRGIQDCHCVYPVKVELFLWNVSQRSNWSNEFLEKLASQLNLQVTQFEIDNFYIVGFSGLNITLDIAPHSGISFSAAQAHAMNVSLTLHEVFIDPNIVGGYKVLNFTWFESPAPSPVEVICGFVNRK
ncbi:hypothetical protein KSP40_PGU015765 [Platanthera guangdongensis]|uniref:Receptor-like PK ALE2 N-terminal domain-containing protein n=1 Tax=Platanthera guangdongensis TaxID=2320717 RepID=A0ABR2M9D8_9ASPA